MSYIASNLKYIRKAKKLTQDAFAEKLGIKRSSVGAYEEGRAIPNLDVLKKLSKIFDLSFEDILLKNLSIEPNLQHYSFTQQRNQQKMSAAAGNLIQFVPVKAAAGYLTGYADNEFIDELNTFTLPMLAAGNYRAFEIDGDSMLPTPSGSVIVGEKVDTLQHVKTSNTYVLLSKYDGVVYKRIQTSKTNSEKEITLISDNPVYRPYTVKYDDILEVWKAVYILQRPDYQYYSSISNLNTKVDSLSQELSDIKKKLN